MPRATLTFELPAERAEFLEAVRAGEMAAALDDIRQRMRATWKWGDFATVDAASAAMDAMYREICEIVQETGWED